MHSVSFCLVLVLFGWVFLSLIAWQHDEQATTSQKLRWKYCNKRFNILLVQINEHDWIPFVHVLRCASSPPPHPLLGSARTQLLLFYNFTLYSTTTRKIFEILSLFIACHKCKQFLLMQQEKKKSTKYTTTTAKQPSKHISSPFRSEHTHTRILCLHIFGLFFFACYLFAGCLLLVSRTFLFTSSKTKIFVHLSLLCCYMLCIAMP